MTHPSPSLSFSRLGQEQRQVSTTPSVRSAAKSGREEERGEASRRRGMGRKASETTPATVRECRRILLLRRHLDDGLFVSSPLVMDNHIGKQMQQAVLGHNRRDSDVLGRGRRNTRASERVLLRQRRELCQSNSGTIRSGFLCFIVLADFYRGRPLAARTTAPPSLSPFRTRWVVLGVFIRTPKITFFSPKHTVCANALLTLYIYTRLTQQSAQSFRRAPSGHFDAEKVSLAALPSFGIRIN